MPTLTKAVKKPNKNGNICIVVGAQCHYSYSACGLGSDGTDRLVQLVQDMQHSKVSKSEDGTLYGAKITGGGSGGTVCVMGRNSLSSSHQIIEVSFFLPFALPLFPPHMVVYLILVSFNW